MSVPKEYYSEMSHNKKKKKELFIRRKVFTSINNVNCSKQHAPRATQWMLLPVSTGLESARDPGPSTATVDSDAARVTEINRGIPSGCVQETHQERAGSSAATLLLR